MSGFFGGTSRRGRIHIAARAKQRRVDRPGDSSDPGFGLLGGGPTPLAALRYPLVRLVQLNSLAVYCVTPLPGGRISER